MIRCLLIHISRNQRKQAIRQEQHVESDIISIGRAAECKIHLPDHRVSLHHAAIRRYEDGRVYIEGESAPLAIDGTLEQSIEVLPGKRIVIGPYEFVVEAVEGDENITLSYELIHPVSVVANVESTTPMTLSETGLSKRKISLWLAAFIAFVFLVMPITYAINPTLHKLLENLPLTPDESWNAGNMSPGHRALTGKCSTCHQKPFQAVTNQACLHCHKSVDNHIANPALNRKVFDEVTCSQCHLDHRGLKGLMRHDSHQCVACHGKIATRNSKTELDNINDFSTDHPGFRLTVRTGIGQGGTQRIRQVKDINLIENSGLKYSHEVHFDKALIELPSGKTRDIVCNDCHKPDDAGIGFKPMTMAPTCQQSKCHALNFDPPVQGRHVPHASVQTVITTLREYYASRAINRIPENVVMIDDLRRLRNQAYADADMNARTLFETAAEGTCLECHEVSPDPDNRNAPWKVAPVRVADRWLPKANFPHNKHQTSKCVDCHEKVMHSDKSSDVLIPTIRNCRECHAGNKQEKTRVRSTCDTCHGFHGVGMHQGPPVEKEVLDDQER